MSDIFAAIIFGLSSIATYKIYQNQILTKHQPEKELNSADNGFVRTTINPFYIAIPMQNSIPSPWSAFHETKTLHKEATNIQQYWFTKMKYEEPVTPEWDPWKTKIRKNLPNTTTLNNLS